MTRLWIVLGLALAGLLGLRAALVADDAVGATAEVALLVDPASSRLFAEDGSQVPVAAVTITRPGPDGRPQEYFWGRSKGVWRCISQLGLVGSEQRLLELLQAVQTTRQLPLPAGDQLDGYGLGPSERVTIELHGANVTKEGAERDVLFAIDVGRPLARGGAFARVGGSGPPVLLELDLATGLRRDPSLTVALSDIETPPLADPHVVPTAWRPLFEGLESVRVERADGTGFHLRRADISVGPKPEGVSAYEVLDLDTGLTTPAHPALSTGYTLFLARTPFVRPRDPRQLPSNPRIDARITLEATSGDTHVLDLLAAGFGGDVTVINRWSNQAMVLTPAVAELLAPEPRQLTDPELGIAWDPYLR